MSELIFRFPLPANLANSRMHPMVKHKSKTAYWAMLDLLVRGKILPRPPEDAPWSKASIRSDMVLFNPMDDGNAVNRHKWIEDWLVKRHYLVDDSKKHLRWEGFPTQRISRKNEPCITVTLTKEDK